MEALSCAIDTFVVYTDSGAAYLDGRGPVRPSYDCPDHPQHSDSIIPPSALQTCHMPGEDVSLMPRGMEVPLF